MLPYLADLVLHATAGLPLGMSVSAGHGFVMPLAGVLEPSIPAARHHGGGNGGLTLAAVVAVLTVVWLIRGALFPFGPCLACRGRRGRRAGSTDKAWGRCRVCKGTGERIRAGRRLLDWVLGKRRGVTDV